MRFFLLICISSVFVISAEVARAAPAVDSGILNFSGKVVEVPCVLSPDSQDLIVDLGNVASSSLATKGQQSPWVTITLNLKDCPSDLPYGTTFTGTTVSDDNTVLANTSTDNPAKNVGVQIFQPDYEQIIAYDGTTSYGRMTFTSNSPPVVDVSKNFRAYMIATDKGVTAGNVSATTTFTITYD